MNPFIPMIAMFVGLGTYLVMENDSYSLKAKKTIRIVACFIMVVLLILGVYSYRQDMERIDEIEKSRLETLEILGELEESQNKWIESVSAEKKEEVK